MWRVIVRFSLSGDQGSTVRNMVIKPKLESVGIRNTKTGTWESRACEIGLATRILTEVIKEVSHISANASSRDPHLNHLWIYLDRVWLRVDD